MAFIQPEPTNRVEMQPVQERGLRWLGNLDTLIARERARLAEQLAAGEKTIPTVSSGPLPGDTNGGLTSLCNQKCGGCSGGCGGKK